MHSPLGLETRTLPTVLPNTTVSVASSMSGHDLFSRTTSSLVTTGPPSLQQKVPHRRHLNRRPFGLGLVTFKCDPLIKNTAAADIYFSTLGAHTSADTGLQETVSVPTQSSLHLDTGEYYDVRSEHDDISSPLSPTCLFCSTSSLALCFPMEMWGDPMDEIKCDLGKPILLCARNRTSSAGNSMFERKNDCSCSHRRVKSRLSLSSNCQEVENDSY